MNYDKNTITIAAIGMTVIFINQWLSYKTNVFM